MVPVSGKDSQLYYIKDVNSHIYIIDLSSETFRSISETINLETGKLNSAYQLKVPFLVESTMKRDIPINIRAIPR